MEKSIGRLEMGATPCLYHCTEGEGSTSSEGYTCRNAKKQVGTTRRCGNF